ncbi:MAG: efflux RND transporter periplasmic adaptor subunit [Chitinophagaceae bacterium]|nr:MAG: efflux RND transporter periplasmic adaptor subunit [Chitinophagaceae bacterium]
MSFKSVKSIFVPAAAALVLAACGNKDNAKQQGPPPAVNVTAEEVKSTDAVYYDEYPGTVVALNQSEIRPQVTGYITGIYFKDGQKVVKGQKLYSIDAQLYSANYQQSLANVAVQEAALERAKKDADRYHELDKQDAIAKQQVDYADAALAAAEKQVAASKASANAVRANVSFATIYAPFTGTIGISQVRTGTSVVAGQSVLNTVSTDNPIAVDFAVDQKEIYRFSQLQQTVKKGDSTFTISFGDDVYPYPGTVALVDRAVDPQTGTIRTRLSFPNEKNMLKAGMTTTVRVLNTASTAATMIPYKAVTEQLGEFYVYVIGDSSKVTQRKVQLGKQVEMNVIIREGLKPGEKIVVQGQQNLREGSVVNTNPAPAPGAPAAPAKK